MTEAWKVLPFLCLIFGCSPKPHPTPPPPTTTTTTLPAPAPTPCLPAAGPGWVPASDQGPTEMLPQVRLLQAELADACGLPPVQSLERLADAFLQEGVCAGVMDDAVFVRRRDGLYEEHHAVFFGDGCWLSNSYRGLWVAP